MRHEPVLAFRFKRMTAEAVASGAIRGPDAEDTARAVLAAPIYLIKQDRSHYDFPSFAKVLADGKIPMPHQNFIITDEDVEEDYCHILVVLTPIDETNLGETLQVMSFGCRDRVIPREPQLNIVIDLLNKNIQAAQGSLNSDKDKEAARAIATLVTADISAIMSAHVEKERSILSPMRRTLIGRPKSGWLGWEYRFVKIPEGHTRPEHQGGTHASPRWHIRRGHFRRLPDGRVIHVRECKVGDPERGAIFKDYDARGPA